MSVAPCFADTNNLALDPATTAEDTQHTQQSILSHTASVFFSLPVSPSVLLPHSFYLSCLSSVTSVISVSYLFPLSYQGCNLSLSFLPQTLSIPPASLSGPLSHSLPRSIIHSVHLNLFPSISLFLSPPPSLSLSLSLSLPSQQLHCPWVEVNNVSPHGAPVQSQPRRQGAPENTHNSMFQLGCGIKGSLTHG